MGFQQFITQMGEFSKMLSMIGDLLNAIKDGRWSDAASLRQALLKQGGNSLTPFLRYRQSMREVKFRMGGVKSASVMAAGISMAVTLLNRNNKRPRH
jgi:hypothetical protein